MRVQFNLADERVDELDRLADELGLGTRTELLNNALTLFEWTVNEVKCGRVIASVIKEDDSYRDFREVTMPAFRYIQNGSGQKQEDNTAVPMK